MASSHRLPQGEGGKAVHVAGHSAARKPRPGGLQMAGRWRSVCLYVGLYVCLYVYVYVMFYVSLYVWLS